MLAHVTAAAVTSENKTLCHPASIDTLSTSAAKVLTDLELTPRHSTNIAKTKEDHVSMGGWAARKSLQVVENVEYVVAIELLCAVQGLEFHRPLKTTAPLEVRSYCVVKAKLTSKLCSSFIAPTGCYNCFQTESEEVGRRSLHETRH